MNVGPEKKGSVYDGWVDGPSVKVSLIIIGFEKVDLNLTPPVCERIFVWNGEISSLGPLD